MAFRRIAKYCLFAFTGETIYMNYKWCTFSDGSDEAVAISADVDEVNRLPDNSGGLPMCAYVHQASTEIRPPRPCLNSHHKDVVDACVVGGGFAGLHVGLTLAERGQRVVILEGSRLGAGASGRNGGFALAGFEMETDRLIAHVGKEGARDLEQQSMDGLVQLESIIKKYDIKCDAEKTGGVFLQFARKFRTKTALQKAIELQQKELSELNETINGSWAVMTKPELEQKGLHSDRFSHGLFTPHNISLNPLALVFGLARACEHNKAVLYEHSPVIHCVRDPANQHWVVTTKSGSVRAKELVLCTNKAPTSISPRLAAMTTSVGTGIFVTKPLPQSLLDETIKTDMGIFDERYALQYCRRMGNRILFGGLAFGAPPHSLEHIRSQLLHEASKSFPSLAKYLQPEYTWIGRMETGFNMFPIVGRTPISQGGMFYALGFSGHGIVPTCAAAKVLADAITSIQPSDPQRGCSDKKYELWSRVTHIPMFQQSKFLPPTVPCFGAVGLLGSSVCCKGLDILDWLSNRV